jgi:hypothetical protein
MRVRMLHSLLFCATASLVAFSVGIWVARGGAQEKLGPGGDEQGITHPRTVRVILPNTLDGQSIPGRGSGLPGRRRDLSPIYPTLPGPHEDGSNSMMAAGTMPSPRARDSDDVSPTSASVLADDTAQSEARAEEGFRDPSTDADVPSASDPRFLRHVPSGSRHARGSYYRHFYLAARRARPLYPYGAFARLSTSDHGR